MRRTDRSLTRFSVNGPAATALSRHQFQTPALVLDLDALENNIATLAADMAGRGLSLRPHAKTHKSADVARLQLRHGAVGLCCATLREAEALADAGIGNLLITSPMVSAQAIERLMALRLRVGELSVVVDHSANVEALAGAAVTTRPLSVIIDLDTGMQRTGVVCVDAAVALARQITKSPALDYAGVQFYCGDDQHITDYEVRRSALVKRAEYLRAVIHALVADGLSPRVITGGGTGSYRIEAELGLLTEIQAGSYVFMDREYSDCDLDGRGGRPFQTALCIDTRIISVNHPNMATVDAGTKALGSGNGPPLVVAGAPDDGIYRFAGDEHGAIIAKDWTPTLGSLVTLSAPHCDPTVNLHDFYHVVRNESLVALWPVSGRGHGATY